MAGDYIAGSLTHCFRKSMKSVWNTMTLSVRLIRVAVSVFDYVALKLRHTYGGSSFLGISKMQLLW